MRHGKRGGASRAQVSLEYLMILGMSLAVLIPASYIFYDYSQGSNDKVVRNQIDSIGSQIVEQAKTVYSLGQGNRITLEMQVPSAVRNITFYDGSEVVFTYNTRQGIQEAVYFPNVNVSGAYQLDNSACPGFCPVSKWSAADSVIGTINLQINSMGSYVLLNQTSY